VTLKEARAFLWALRLSYDFLFEPKKPVTVTHEEIGATRAA
jgi:hypothetical protein